MNLKFWLDLSIVLNFALELQNSLSSYGAIPLKVTKKMCLKWLRMAKRILNRSLKKLTFAIFDEDPPPKLKKLTFGFF